MPQFLIDSTDACLDKLYIMAFTSGIDNAQSDSAHAVEILAAGDVRTLQLYNLPGNDALRIKVICGSITLLVSIFHPVVSPLVVSRKFPLLKAATTVGTLIQL